MHTHCPIFGTSRKAVGMNQEKRADTAHADARTRNLNALLDYMEAVLGVDDDGLADALGVKRSKLARCRRSPGEQWPTSVIVAAMDRTGITWAFAYDGMARAEAERAQVS